MEREEIEQVERELDEILQIVGPPQEEAAVCIPAGR